MFTRQHPFRRRACAAGLVLVASIGAQVVADYPVAIEYEQALDLILTEQDLNSDGWSHKITWIAASGDGQTVGFWTIAEKVGAAPRVHMWVMKWDGSGRREITPDMSGLNPRWPRLNDDGSRMFFMADYHNEIAYIDTASGALVSAVPAASDVDFRKPYEINADGTTVTFLDWDPDAEGCARYGVSTATVPGAPMRLFSLAELPFGDYCNKNRVAFLGASDTGRAIVSWRDNDFCGQCSALFCGYPGPVNVMSEQVEFVYSLQDLPHRQMSRDGGRCLYHRGDYDGGDVYRESLELVDLDDRTATVLIEGEVGHPAVSPDGDLVRFNGPAGAYATVMDVSDGTPGTVRDTVSYFTPLLDAWSLTDICNNNRRWYSSSFQDFGAKQKIYRVDRNPVAGTGEFGDGPRITGVSWSRPALLHDGQMTISVYVDVSDPQGLGNVDWVLVVSRIDHGREAVEWDTRGRDPLSTGGDSSGGYVYDDGDADGTTGDAVAGDGTFTGNNFYTRAECDFWGHYAAAGLPIDVPVRVIAKDDDDNYTFVDTFLTVTDDPAAAEPDDSSSGSDDGGDGDDDDAVDDDDNGDDADDGGDVPDDNTDGGTSDDDGDDSGPVDDGSSGIDGDDDSDDVLPDDADSDQSGDTGGNVTPTGGLCPTSAALVMGLAFAGLIATRRR